MPNEHVFCWAWELGCNTQNAAAWVQGIGSIIGLFIAFYVPWQQYRNQVRAAERRERMDIATKLDAIVAIASQGIAIKNIFDEASKSDGIEKVHFNPDLLTFWRGRIESLPILDIPNRTLIILVPSLAACYLEFENKWRNWGNGRDILGEGQKELYRSLDEIELMSTMIIDACLEAGRELGLSVKEFEAKDAHQAVRDVMSAFDTTVDNK